MELELRVINLSFICVSNILYLSGRLYLIVIPYALLGEQRKRINPGSLSDPPDRPIKCQSVCTRSIHRHRNDKSIPEREDLEAELLMKYDIGEMGHLN